MEHLVFLSHNSKDHAIANALCHYLEDAGIRCWIAPRDVDSTDWADSIMDGLRRSDIFVVIISKNSIESPEVAKEVTEATRSCEYILPFKIDEEMLNPRLQYHLGPCHWMDAISPPLEKHIQELIDRIHHLNDTDMIYVNRECRRLVSNTVLPKSYFVGRSQEILDIHTLLQQDHVLFLQGMGGIGKSELAKGYAKAYADEYDTVIFAHYEDSILNMVCSEDIKILNFSRNMSYGEEAESAEAYFSRKMDVLQDLMNTRCLLIVDNFDTEEDPDLEKLTGLPCHILITTRVENFDYATLPVGPISSFDTVRNLFVKHYGGRIPPKDLPFVDDILRLIGGHTITVELIAKQMMASHVPVKKMLSILQEQGIQTQLREKVRYDGHAAAQSAFGYIKELFHFAALSQDEIYILRNMCMVPPRGLDFSLFSEILELEDFDTVNSLLRKSWLMTDEETGYLMMHPIICDVVKAELKPDNVSCQEYVLGVWRAMAGAWHMDRDTRAERWPLVDHLMRCFPTPTPALARPYASFVNIAWICGQYTQSIAAAQAYYDYILKTFGPNTFEAGTAARSYAAAYHNGGNDDAAEPYYRLSLEHQRNAPNKTHKEMGIILNRVGRCARRNGDFEEAKALLDESLDALLYQHSIDPEDTMGGDPLHNCIANTYVELERLYMAMGAYTDALDYCQKAYDQFYTWKNKEIVSSGYCLSDFGKCHTALGNYQKAEQYLLRAIALFEELIGSTHVDAVYAREALGDNYLARGDRENAKTYFTQLELELEKDFGENSPLVQRIRQKAEAI